MWIELLCGLILYRFVKRCFYGVDQDNHIKNKVDQDNMIELQNSNYNTLFTVAKRLENLYYGSKVYVGLQIPDPESASRKNVDIVVVTKEEAIVISVKNVSGFVSTDKDGNWVCKDGNNHIIEHLSDPVAETRQLVSTLGEYLEQRGVALPQGYLSFKVICTNPKSFIRSDSFPSEVITYSQWTQLKPEKKNIYSGWINGAKKESFHEKLNSVLKTAPIWDRLELEGNKNVLGEFLEFKGRQDDLQALRKIKRSKVSRLMVQKTTMFGFALPTLKVLYAPRNYHVEEASWSSKWEQVSVASSIEVAFQPQNSKKVYKWKLGSVMSMSFSA